MSLRKFNEMTSEERQEFNELLGKLPPVDSSNGVVCAWLRERGIEVND